MAGQYTPDYLAAMRDGVERFEAAFGAWMETQEETDRMFMPGIVERVFTRNDADPAEVERLELACSLAAYRAVASQLEMGSKRRVLRWRTTSSSGRESSVWRLLERCS
jgi:hypothetical protein